MNQRKAGTILTYLHVIMTNTIGLIYAPYMLRVMGQSEYGLNGTASSFISYLSLLSFGIGGAYIRYNAKYRAANDREGEKKLNGMFLIIFSIVALISVIGGAIITIFAGSLTKNTFTAQEIYKLRIIMMLLTFNTALTFVENVVFMILQAYEEFVFIKLVLLITGLINPIINVIALQMGGRSITITVISVVISCICYLSYYLYAKKKVNMEFLFHDLPLDEFKEILVFSSFLFLGTISDQITNSTDSVILSMTKGTAAVAVYTVGASFKNYFLSFSTSVSSVFAAKVNQMVAQKCSMSELDDIFIKVGRIQFYIVSLIMIGFTLVGKPFIRLWAGEDYVDSFYIAWLIMAAIFVPCFQNVGIEIQKAFNKHQARSIIYLIVSITNVIMTIPMAIKWSGIGAALATFICVIFGQVIWMNYYYHNTIHLNIIRFWKSILSIIPGFIIPIIGGIVCTHYLVFHSLLTVLLAALIITILYLVSIWFISMNEYEKQLLIKPMTKCRNKLIGIINRK